MTEDKWKGLISKESKLREKIQKFDPDIDIELARPVLQEWWKIMADLLSESISRSRKHLDIYIAIAQLCVLRDMAENLSRGIIHDMKYQIGDKVRISPERIKEYHETPDSDWVQVDLARINPYASKMDGKVDEVVPVLKKMKAQGKGIIGMKIFGAGELVDKVDECLQYALGQDFIDCFTIGQEGFNETKDLLTRIPESSVRG